MEKKAKVPKLRFPGFTGEWQERKLGDVMERYEKPVATPHTGYIRLGIRSHAKGTFHNYVEPGEELETAQMYEVIANKFIVNITFAWEQAVAITDKGDTGKLVSHRFPQFRFIAGNVPQFFKYVIADARFKYHLGLSSPGGAGRNRVLNINEMLKYVLKIPSREEQEQLGKFLDKIDENIKLQQYKLEHLQTQKKSLLQKMFPKKGERFPELRFPGFTDAWEQRKLGELSEVYDGTHQTPNYTDTGVMFLSVENIKTLQSEKYISKEDFEKEFKIFPEKGDVLMTRIGDIGTVNVVESDDPKAYYVSLALLKHKKLDPYFLKESLSSETVKRELWHRTLHIAFPNKINKNEICNVSISYPKLEEEQYQIGVFFHRLNNLITLHQRKLTHLKTQKKALLQQMFV